MSGSSCIFASSFLRGVGLALLCLLPLWLATGSAASAKGNKSSVIVENNVPKIFVNGKPINNMFGINVYTVGMNPETPEFIAGMEKTIDRASALKIPVVSFQVLWKDYDHSETVPANAEEAAQRFKTAGLDRILDYAAKKNVYVVLQLLTISHFELPGWWKSFGQNASGHQLLGPSNAANEAYNKNTSPVAAYRNPDHRALITALFKRIVSRYREHPALIGWATGIGTTGENGYGPNYIELMFNPSLPKIDFLMAMADYSPLAGKYFTQWLQAKYASIEKLNGAWGTKYKDFREVVPPDPKRTSIEESFKLNGDNRPSMMDWQWFRHDTLMDEWRFFSGLLHGLDPDKVVMGTTFWTPMGPQTGSEFMTITAIPVNAEKLLDVDIVYPGLTFKDYQPEFDVTNSYSLLDYTFFSRFSKNYGMARIVGVENWVKRTNPGKIDINRSMALKEILKREGCYLWLDVILDGDKLPKPDWSWDEVEELVGRSGAEELKNVRLEEPALKFYCDALNPMSHYADALPGLKMTGLQFAFARAIFDSTQQPVGFISAENLASANPAKTRVIALANQRILSPSVMEQLKKYRDAGGTLLLLGSNGVFGDEGRKDDAALRALIPGIAGDQLQGQYEWGLHRKIKVPFFVIKRGETRFYEFDVSANPATNFRLFKESLSGTISLPEQGSLVFTTSTLRPVSGERKTMEITPPRPGEQGGESAPAPPSSSGAPPPPPSRSEGQMPPPPGGGPSPSLARQTPGAQITPDPGAPPPVRFSGDINQFSPKTRDFIAKYDKDGDMLVVLHEYTGPIDLFLRLDANRDGVITPQEAEQGLK